MPANPEPQQKPERQGDPPDGRPLSDRLAGGFAIVLAQTLASKVVRAGSQIALAWFLSPRDFGVAAIPLAAYGIASLLCAAPVEQKLMQLARRAPDHATEATWFALAIGAAMAAGLVILAPFLASTYGDPRLAPLMGILAAAIPPMSIASVARGLLNVELRFGVINIISFTSLTLQSILTVIFAWLGFGPYSLIVPIAIVSVLSLPPLWNAAHVLRQLRWRPNARRTKEVVFDAVWIWGAALPALLIDRGVYFIGGRDLSQADLGLYYFAYALVMQLIVLLGRNIANVLTPGFSLTAGDGEAGVPRLNRAVRLTSILAGGACLAVAVLARPLVEAVFPPKWSGTIAIVQVLALGLAATPASSVLQAYLYGGGRFRGLAWVNWIRLFALLPALMLLAPYGLEWFAGAVCLPYVVEPLLLLTAVRAPFRARASLLGRGVIEPLLVAAVPALGALAAGAMARHAEIGPWGQVAAGAMAFTTVWVFVVRWWMPATWAEIVHRGRTLLQHQRSRPLTGSGA